jgi:2-polyprenyl-3-methyl-5-hydroxy-6-metoxy-1,4-benzoquinol methylase
MPAGHDGRMSGPDSSVEQQRAFWNAWNREVREGRGPDHASLGRGEFVLEALRETEPPPGACILEVGCGTGWLTAELVRFGTVTAIDLADEVVDRARSQVQAATFLAGDFFTLDLPEASFDVVVTLETLSHVAEQHRFFGRIASLLKPRGVLILTTQNRFVMERITVMRQEVGQLRHWVTRSQLRRQVRPHFKILKLSTIMPVGGRGLVRMANSTRVSSLLSRVVGPRVVRTIQERAGFGQTIVLLATRRVHG